MDSGIRIIQMLLLLAILVLLGQLNALISKGNDETSEKTHEICFSLILPTQDNDTLLGTPDNNLKTQI